MLFLSVECSFFSSTQCPALALLNVDLDRLYVPFGEDQNTVYDGQLAEVSEHWHQKLFTDEPVPFDQYLYTFPKYATLWSSEAERVKTMRSYAAAHMI